MKQISDKVNSAIRRFKNKGKKITAAEARDSTYLDKLEDENGAEDSHSSDLLYKAKNRTRYNKRKVPKITRYVRYNKKKDLENYCREQLLLFIPWRNEQKDLLASFDTFEAHYNSLKTSIHSKSNAYENHTEQPELAR